MPRLALFTPLGTKNGPPQPDQLRETRRTTCYLPTGEQTPLEDNWKVEGHRTLAERWTGTTEFEENIELGLEAPTLRGKPATGLTLPFRTNTT